MARDEWQLEAERLLFDLGKVVLGKNAGGMVNRLMKSRGISSARLVLKMAAEKSNPREYVGAVLKEPEVNSRAVVGESVGKYRWTGSRWAEVEK